jgi:hypothetical protein
MDITRATEATAEVTKTVEEIFTYQPWSAEQELKGTHVRNALAAAVCVIIANVPPSADRSAAIRKIREARMDCNSAITHAGKY